MFPFCARKTAVQPCAAGAAGYRMMKVPSDWFFSIADAMLKNKFYKISIASPKEKNR